MSQPTWPAGTRTARWYPNALGLDRMVIPTLQAKAWQYHLPPISSVLVQSHGEMRRAVDLLLILECLKLAFGVEQLSPEARDAGFELLSQFDVHCICDLCVVSPYLLMSSRLLYSR